ncbi:SUKH-3 domain-containing protein [Streptomyces bambusae]|uniref:SUKH-3 domain containing protein n=1 Tax=Streptomyces bambusae TaxID=1550616 RepID=A0ABS6Z818_9ACTN|nr:SUKH-3 domain-containing protein [Streptomyces bambusae]MBW5483896.1 hypothetical protein [Streptomyces bambusae]
MPFLRNAAEVDAWFMDHGWFPGRDVSDQVPALVDAMAEDYAQAGFPMSPSPAALRFLAEHAGLRLTISARRGDHLLFTPCRVSHYDPEDLAALDRCLGGVGLFPVGIDTSEGSPIDMDAQGRFFYRHHTGAYYMGADKYEAMISLGNAPMRDAEDFFVRPDLSWPP